MARAHPLPRLLAGLGLALGLSGCGALLEPETRNVKPAVSSAPGNAPAKGAAATPVGGGIVQAVSVTSAAAERSHSVARGDTLYSVARRHSTTPGEIARLNDLAPPFAIQPGQVLRLPASRAGRATTQADAAPILVAANVRPQVQNAQAPGSVIARMPPAGKGNGAPPPVAAPRSGVTQVELPPPTAAVPDVKPVDAQPLAARAGEVKPGIIVATEAKPLPPMSAPPVQLAAAPKTSLPALPTSGASGATGPTAEQIAAVVAPAPEPAARPASPMLGTAVPAPPPRSASGFILPLDGRIISTFGPQAGGLSNDGINIAAPKGTPVKAAEHGVVVYAGNELRGFGNMLLVRHADGWMTAYAHLDQMAVGRGTRVERGQHIGNVGMTGNVTSPQLHFEIRQGKQPVDPEKQIAGGIAPTASARTTAAKIGAIR
ncbi:MAG: peptidoglycan DD-metalloendopeptidase family protein [Rhodospirillales bacterium]|nr:peptidoglycan DD-metalloendopeptidase family protein [Rhodospirillales bacterium]